MRRAEFHGFIITLLFSIICTFLLGSCAGSGQVQEADPSLQANIRQRSEQLDRVRSLISLGTPRSLDVALNIIERNDLENTEQGAEFRYVIGRIYHIVYPYLEYSSLETQAPAGSIFTSIFTEVENRRVPEIEQESTTYLTSLAVATSILSVREADQVEKAGGTISYLVKINPDSILTLFLNGLYLEREKDYQSAEFFYRQALDRDNSCYPARLGLVRIYYYQGKPKSALEDLEILLLEFPEEMEVLEWAFNIYLQDGQLQKADSLLSQAIIRYPEELIFLRKRVELLDQQEKHEQADRIARLIEKSIGETEETVFIRLKSLIRQGRPGLALSTVEEAMEKFPDYREFSILYGSLLLQLNRQEDAYSFFREELEKNPDNLTIIASLLETAAALEKWEEASGYVELLLPQRESVGLYIQAIEVYRRLDQTEKALEYARLLAQSYPDRAGAVEPYVSLLIELGRIDQATELIGRLQVEERSAEVKSMLYYFLSILVDDRESKLQNLQLALLENIQNFAALRDIALLYESLGEYNKAVRYLRQAIVLQPQNEVLKQKLREIEAMR